MTDSLAESDASRARLPTKFTPETRGKLIAASRTTGGKLALCAKVARISRDTLYEWMRNPNELPELEEFRREFEAAAGEMTLDRLGRIEEAGEKDWRATAWVLERTDEEFRPVSGIVGQLGLKVESVDALSEEQMAHRIVQMLAHPTKAMQELMRKAWSCCNETVREMMAEQVAEWENARVDALEAHGEDVPSEPMRELPEDEPEQEATGNQWSRDEQDDEIRVEMTPELEQHIAEFRDILRDNDRVAMGGVPMSGKGVFLKFNDGRPVFHTDEYIEPARAKFGKDYWSKLPQLVLPDCENLDRFLLVGIRATGCIAAGLEVDVLVWLDSPMEPEKFPEKLQAMAQGRRTRLERFRKEHPDTRVVML